MRGLDWKWLASVSLVALAVPAVAQESGPTPPKQAEPPRSAQADDPNVIIVIGQRVIVASLADMAVEDSYDEDDVASYAASTLGELLAEIEGEKGDAAPSLLVNGRPVADINDISDLPVEAVRKIEVLPRGAAQRINGAAGQRAYNIVLKPSVKSATLTASRELATEGGWTNNRGEAILTRIKGQERTNLSLRGAQSGKLFESERDFVPRTDGTPYSPLGNIVPAAGTEVDPAFSLFAGVPVTVIGVPSGLIVPSFADLLSGANERNASGQEVFRTLRGASRPIDLNISANRTLSPHWSLSLNGRLGWLRSESASGLPSARFLLPASHPSSPFTTSVGIAVNDPSRRLDSRYVTASKGLSATLNGTFASWRGTLNGRWDDRESRTAYEFSGPLESSVIDPSQNPFDGSLGSLIPIAERRSRSESATRLLAAEADGPLLGLWAGTLRARAGAGVTWLRFDADDFSGRRDGHRRELSAKAGLTLPLTSDTFLAALGSSELSLDWGLLDAGDEVIHRRTLAFNWQPLDWLRFTASAARDGRPIPLELLSAPSTSFPNVPYFDPVTGETVDVTTVSGGASGLRHESTRRKSVALTLTPLVKYRLQLEAEYAVDQTRDPVGFLPPPSTALVTAFPDRFVRDSSGTLVLVDQRPINFSRETYRALRLRTGFTIPLSPTAPVKRAPGAKRPIPTRLQVNAAHAFVLDSTSVLRPGFPEIDLRQGGAIGVTGGLQRDRSTASVALTHGGSGIRAEWQRRGRGYLVTGTLLDPDRLTFQPLSTFDIKAFADLAQVAPSVALLQKTRLTVALDNLLNRRERVRDLDDLTPQAYQPIRREPIGRTVTVELRKTF